MRKQKLKTIQVGILHHPFGTRQATICEVPFHRQTLEELKEKFAYKQDVIVGLDGRTVEDMKTRVKAGSKVLIMPAAAGPIKDAFDWVKGGLEWFSVKLVEQFVLPELGGALFNQLLKPSEPEAGQSHSWAPMTTQREGGVRPECFGTNMHYGNCIARWTDIDGNGDEILYMKLDYGKGPIEGRGSNPVYFNDQPSTNFSGVTLQDRRGTLNQTCMTGFEKTKLEYRPGWTITNTGGAATFVTPNNFFDDVEYTLEFPSGIYQYHKDGSRKTHSIDVKVEISVRDADDWTTLMDTSISGNQIAPVYKAYKASVQGFSCVYGNQYDLKITKTSTDESAETFGDILKLRSVREVVDTAFTHPGRALLGITALATNLLSGHLNVKWIADDKIVNTFNGTSWTLQHSNNRAWIALSVLTQPKISGDGDGTAYAIERYDGLAITQVDLALFYEWAQWCDVAVTDGDGGTEDRMPCNIRVDYQTDVWTLSYQICQVGRMYPYWQGNTLTGWIDKAVTSYIDLVTFDNTMMRTWRSAWAGSGEMAGGVDVYFRDSIQGYERKMLPFSNENAGLYTRRLAIEAPCVTQKTLAARVANHALNRNRYINNVNSVVMYKDALRYSLGRVVRLQSKVPNWGESFRVIISEANNTVKLDRDIDADENDLVFVRTYDTVNREVAIDSYTVDSCADDVLTIKETWDVTPIKNNIIAVGVTGAIKLRRIIEMTYRADNYIDVKFETYDTTLFDSDGTDPNITNPDYIWPQPATGLVRPANLWDVANQINQLLPPQPDIEIPWPGNCEWTGSGGTTVSWSARDGSTPILFRFRGTTYEITADSTTNEFIYWDPNYTTTFRHTNLLSTALTAGNWFMCRNKDGVAYPTVPMQSIHAGLLQAGTITAAYGQIGNLAVGTAQLANGGVTEGKLDTDAVTRNKIKNQEVIQAKLALLAVDTPQLAALAVEESKIAGLAVTNAKIGLLAVEEGNIKNLSVTTLKIAGNAVTLPVSAYTSGAITINASDTTIQSVAITTTGSPVGIWFAFIPVISSTTTYIVKIYRDAVKIYESGGFYNAGIDVNFASLMKETPSATSHTYYMKVIRSGGAMTATCRSMIVMEVKK